MIVALSPTTTERILDLCNGDVQAAEDFVVGTVGLIGDLGTDNAISLFSEQAARVSCELRVALEMKGVSIDDEFGYRKNPHHVRQ